METSILNSIYDAVVTVPGVYSFANFSAKLDSELKTKDVSKAVEILSTEAIDKVKVHLILINGVNISDVVKEVQIRVKYELEKIYQFKRNYIVDVAVDDIVVL